MLQGLSQDKIVITQAIDNIIKRAKLYIKSGLTVHFTGPSGTGKTTMALKLAKDLHKPYYFIQGDENYNRNDLVGGLFGYSQKIVEDNFIPSVSKIERKLTPLWVDNPIALACREGATLVYDEFSRSTPETNNVLLGILSEKIILTTDTAGQMTMEKVHPDFTLILSSNPQDYNGVNKVQDALMDRLISLNLTKFDETTESLIVAHQCQIPEEDALHIVRFINYLNARLKLGLTSTRNSIKLGKIYYQKTLQYLEDDLFYQCLLDILRLSPQMIPMVAAVWKETILSSGEEHHE